jgi:hypothetical protein
MAPGSRLCAGSLATVFKGARRQWVSLIFRLVRLRIPSVISSWRDGMKKAAYLGSILFVVLPACSNSQQIVVSPTPPTTPPATISILSSNGQGNLGAQSFSPNPSPQSQSGVAWHNSDSTIHHIVSDDGLLDTGDIAPGSTSAAKAPSGGAGVRYHCTIHPTMVGTIVGYWDY